MRPKPLMPMRVAGHSPEHSDYIDISRLNRHPSLHRASVRSMSVDLELAPKQKRAAGEPCCEPVVYPDVEREQALRMADVAKALGDPDPPAARRRAAQARRQGLRVRARAALRHRPAHALAPPQEAARRRHRRLRAPRLWAYYYVKPEALEALSAWLEPLSDRTTDGTMPEQLQVARPFARRCASATPPPPAQPRPRPSSRLRLRPAGSRAAARMRRRRTSAAEVFGAALYDDAEAEPTRRRPPSAPRWAAACRPPSPTSTRARRCSTSARARAPTCSSAPGASGRPARRSVST